MPTCSGAWRANLLRNSGTRDPPAFLASTRGPARAEPGSDTCSDSHALDRAGSSMTSLEGAHRPRAERVIAKASGNNRVTRSVATPVRRWPLVGAVQISIVGFAVCDANCRGYSPVPEMASAIPSGARCSTRSLLQCAWFPRQAQGAPKERVRLVAAFDRRLATNEARSSRGRSARTGTVTALRQRHRRWNCPVRFPATGHPRLVTPSVATKADSWSIGSHPNNRCAAGRGDTWSSRLAARHSAHRRRRAPCVDGGHVPIPRAWCGSFPLEPRHPARACRWGVGPLPN